MYLTKKTYVQQWAHHTPEERIEITITKGGKPMDGVDVSKIKYVEEEVMYWRKANQIHGWFVNNIQNGEDNCQTSYLDGSQLLELLNLCKSTIEVINKSELVTKTKTSWGGSPYEVQVYDCADELEFLPPTQGFFFGSDEIDQYYKQDIEDTIACLEKLVDEDGQIDGDFYYHASW